MLKIDKPRIMKRLLFVLIIILNCCISNSQNNTKVDTLPPRFRGSSDINYLREYLQKEFIYPQVAIKNGEQGTVILKFQITDEANIDSIEVLNRVSQSIDYESIRCLLTTKSQWIPGEINGRKTSFSLIVPIKLIIEFGMGENYFINKGNKLFLKMDYKNALRYYTEAVKINPYNIDIIKKKIECEEKLNLTFDIERDKKLLDYINKILLDYISNN